MPPARRRAPELDHALPVPDAGRLRGRDRGHLYKSKLVVAIGILMIFSATLLLPLAVIATEDEPESNPQILAPGTR